MSASDNILTQRTARVRTSDVKCVETVILVSQTACGDTEFVLVLMDTDDNMYETKNFVIFNLEMLIK